MSHEEAVKILLSLGLVTACTDGGSGKLLTNEEYARARVYDTEHSPLHKFLEAHDRMGYDRVCAEAVRTILGSN